LAIFAANYLNPAVKMTALQLRDEIKLALRR
jgi:hypothetical protein